MVPGTPRSSALMAALNAYARAALAPARTREARLEAFTVKTADYIRTVLRKMINLAEAEPDRTPLIDWDTVIFGPGGEVPVGEPEDAENGIRQNAAVRP